MTRDDIYNACGKVIGGCLLNPKLRACLDENNRECFVDGAEWRINSVWHDADEEPEQEDEPILVEYEDWGIEGSDYTVCDDIWDYRFRLKRDGACCTILRWAYMKDLIPERKEETNGGR